ncbi:MAG: HD domain-containing phosphohydrolase [Fibrobacterota bacterium]
MTIDEKMTLIVIDDDTTLGTSVKRFLEKKGHNVLLIDNCESALDIMNNNYPDLILVDLNMPGMSGLDFLKLVRQRDKIVPVLITTGDPDIDTVIEAIHNGAQDYIVKPFSLTLLSDKIDETMEVLNTYKSTNVLSELVSIHSVSNKLSSTREYETVLDIAFSSCRDATRAGSGYIMLSDTENRYLNLVRVQGEYHGAEFTRIPSNDGEWPIAKWVFRKNRAIAIYNGKSFPYQNLPFTRQVRGVTIVSPIRVNGKPRGVVSMSRDEDDGEHGKVELSLLEILAGQLGNALGSVELYNTLNKRISDLHFISDYAEKFVGLVNPENVVKSFVDTICSYFNVDYVGVLFRKKRGSVLYSWSKYFLSPRLKDRIIDELITCYNDNSQSDKASVLQVTTESISGEEQIDETPESFEFTKTLPLIWGDFEFGAITLKWRTKGPDIDENVKLLRGIVNQTRIALTNAKLFNDIKENYIRTIKALAIAVDAKDTYTHGHSENVMFYSEILARYMGMDEDTVQVIKDGGLLHDIGKIGIPGVILNKPGPLTDSEYNGFMKTHPALGADIIKDVPFLKDLKPIILYHHEHQDGTGYPEGLEGRNIPVGARIVHIADAFEAMTSNRPYRKSLGNREAVQRLRAGAGSQFDEALVDKFIDAMVEAGKLGEDDVAL